LAQWLEHAVHIRGVTGSNPVSPTTYPRNAALGVRFVRRSSTATFAPAMSLTLLLTVGCGAVPAPTPAPTRTGAAPTMELQGLQTRLAPLVLQADDLAAIGKPSDWQRFDEGPLLRADMPGGLRADPGRFGRLGGWKSRYRVSDPAATGLAFVIESRVDLFSDGSGPSADLQAVVQDAPRTSARVVPAPRPVGEAATALISEQAAPHSIGYYTIAWRRGPILASVVVSGFKDVVSLAQATTLAELVDRRLAGAGS
jgi:hypothetical protein